MTLTEKQNINNLAAAYLAEPSNASFADLYEPFRIAWRRRLRRDVERSLSGDEAEVQAMYDDCLMKALEKWTPGSGDLEHMVNKRIKQRQVSLVRSNLRREKRLESLDELREESEDKAPNLFPELGESPYVKPTEEDAIKKMTESGRQAIIDHLLYSAKSDSATIAVVAVLKVVPFESRESLAKATGIHHETVKRKLRALARRYDGNRFGDIHDYLAV